MRQERSEGRGGEEKKEGEGKEIKGERFKPLVYLIFLWE